MFWPLVVYFILVIALMFAMLTLSYLLGGRHRQVGTAIPYEGGVPSTGGAQVRLSARFYLVAMFFVVFDLESAFIFSWAVVARQVGWFGYIEIAVFIVILLLTLWYLARIGALEWSEVLRPAQARAFAAEKPQPGREVNV